MDPQHLRLSLRLVLVLACVASITSLSFHNDGYTGLVVAIADWIPEDQTFIEEIKKMFVSASSYLYTATNQKAYYRNVTILVPKNWTRQASWQAPKGESFQTADVRVDKPHPLYGNNPYTFQPGQCGEPGRYIHLVPQFVADATWREATFGDGGRVLVHEFGHLRYGVFDEYGDGSRRYPNFYLDPLRRIKPTACSAAILGKYLRPSTSKACPIDLSTRLPTRDCVFYPLRANNTIKASVMYQQAIPSIDHFCVDSNDTSLGHNAYAPNQHNAMCNKRATWEIIGNHADFRNGNSPSTVNDTRPTFTIVQEPPTDTTRCGRRAILVMDVSGSMDSDSPTRLTRQRQTAATIINSLPSGSVLGMVKFASTASILQRFTTVSNDSDRKILRDILPMRTEGGTAIGAGLQLAIQMFNSSGGSTSQDHIFLTTDGEENELPYVANILDVLLASGVHIHTLAYTSAASGVLKNVSYQTDGLYFSFDGSSSSTDLDSAASKIVDTLTICKQDTRIDVDRISFSVTASGGFYRRDVVIDSTVGRNLTFTFVLSRSDNIEATVTSPKGNVYNITSPEYLVDDKLHIITVTISEGEPGQWTYTVSSSTAFTGTATVQAQAIPEIDPIEITAWMGDLIADPSKGDYAVVYTYAHQGYFPLLNANVVATITRPTGRPVDLPLKDDGFLPDNRAGDGVYSAYFTDYNGNNRYSTAVKVFSINGTVLLKLNGTATGAFPVEPVPPPQPVMEPVDNLARTSTAGAFDTQGSPPLGDDIIPPASVTDLRVVLADNDTRQVSLTWTAPGDDLRTGTASLIDLRIGSSYESLSDNFSSCLQVTPSMLSNGNLVPVEAGLQQEVTVSLNGTFLGLEDTFVFGLKFYDEANQSSSVSNLVVATFGHVTSPQNTGPDLIVDDPDKGGNDDNVTDSFDDATVEPPPTSQLDNQAAVIGGIVGGFVGVAVVVSLVVVGAVKLGKMRKSKTVQARENGFNADLEEVRVPPAPHTV